MAITTLLDPTLLPARTMDQSAFDAAMAYLMTNLPTWGAQTNALQANLNSIAAGGAYAIPYILDTTTTAVGDPGDGRMRFNQYSLQYTSTVLVLDDLSTDGTSHASDLDNMDASTSTVKGAIRIVKVGDPSKWLTFNVTAIGRPGGYHTATVVNVGGSAASPFANGDAVLLLYQRAGDKGDAGSLTPVLWARDEKASGQTGGSAAASTYVTRTLNTIKKNTISGASVSSNQITLPAGTYRVSFAAPAYNVAGHQAYLYNVTDAATAISGSTAYASGSSVQTESGVRGTEIVLTASKVFELRHWTTTNTAGSGLGLMASSGQGEVYAQVFIEKVA